MAVSGTAVALTTTGFLFFWSGLKGWMISGTLQDMLTGHKPSHYANQIATPPPTPGSASVAAGAPGATGSQIADDALKYKGATYVWGGNPSKGIGNWDCSSFVSWVLGHDLKMSIPGYPNGTYTGSVHGPVTGQYLVWSGAHNIPRASMQAGDLLCWPTHIGIAISGSQMISALDHKDGTIVTDIAGGSPHGEPLMVRRIG